MIHTYDREVLNANQLKSIAIIAMLIDHIAGIFLSNESYLAVFMHFIGRTTAPIMFYLAVEGYHKTRNIKKYIIRLAIFALISYVPYIYYNNNGSLVDANYFSLNVIFTILFGVLAISIRRNINNTIIKLLLIFLLLVLSIICDWGILGVMIIIVFDYYYAERNDQLFGYFIVIFLGMDIKSFIFRPIISLIYEKNIFMEDSVIKYGITNLGLIIPIFLLSFYNGERGSNNSFYKWFFYIFYPVHLFILGFIKSIT